MKSKIYLVFILLTAVSCAKSESEDWRAKEILSVDSWMQLNHGESLQSGQIVRYDNGVYLEKLRPSVAGARKPSAGVWIELNYRGTTLDNRVYLTRYEQEARREGTFTYYTHYVPHYMLYSSNVGLVQAEKFALENMVEGDSMRIYTPSGMAYGQGGLDNSKSYGYAGSLKTIGANVPVIIDLVLKRIIDEPDLEETIMVQNRASQWGLGINDTISPALYLDPMEVNTSAGRIAADSTVFVEYTGRYLDGFLLTSNVDSVRVEEFKDYTSQTPYSYKVSTKSSPTFPSAAFYELFSSGQLYYDSYYRTVFTSRWAYSATGVAAAAKSPVVYPYTPLEFEFRTMPANYGKD